MPARLWSIWFMPVSRRWRAPHLPKHKISSEQG
jgi:hypothetical protein